MTKISIKPLVDSEAILPDTNNPWLTQLLHNRGITKKSDIKKFLEPSYDGDLHDPFLLHDMAKGVERILTAMKNNEKIVIFSDYDCDGIPGAVVLHDFFKTVGFTNFTNHIPHRHFDGFGLSVEAVGKIKTEQNPTLIITIDCGTGDLEAIKRGKELGMEVIVTDHHEPKVELPEAVAIVNPKVGDTYPFTGLCGTAVIYKLVQALIARGNFDINSGREKWWLDMVGIATIADMVPLTDENRTLAFYGLKVLRKTRRLGLQKLFTKQKVEPRFLTEDDIGFTIGPRINAASRMDNPEDAFVLLSTTDFGEADSIVTHLEKINTARKTAVAQITKDLNKRLHLEIKEPEIFVMGDSAWRPSLVGLAANKLAEETHKPAFLWGQDGKGKFKGSCRSGGVMSVVNIMSAAPELFTEFGGHHMAGGFTVREEKIFDFSRSLTEAFEKLGQAAAVDETVEVDMELTLDLLDDDLLLAQKQCAPFGLGNPKPIYLFKNVIPKLVTTFGKTNEHTKLVFSTSGIAKEAIAFFKLPKDFSQMPKANLPCTLIAHLEEGYFLGRQQIRLRVVDVL